MAIPYVHRPDINDEPSLAGTLKVLPMAAMFMRSKILSWAALFIAVQTYLAEPAYPKEGSSALSAISTALMSLAVTYMDFVYIPGRKA